MRIPCPHCGERGNDGGEQRDDSGECGDGCSECGGSGGERIGMRGEHRERERESWDAESVHTADRLQLPVNERR